MNLTTVVSLLRRKKKKKVFKYFAPQKHEIGQIGLLAMDDRPKVGDILENLFEDGESFVVKVWDAGDCMWLDHKCDLPEGPFTKKGNSVWDCWYCGTKYVFGNDGWKVRKVTK